MGEAFTTYRFNKDALVEIGFSSDYDWIDEKVKKNNIPTSNLTNPLI